MSNVSLRSPNIGGSGVPNFDEKKMKAALKQGSVKWYNVNKVMKAIKQADGDLSRVDCYHISNKAGRVIDICRTMSADRSAKGVTINDMLNNKAFAITKIGNENLKAQGVKERHFTNALRELGLNSKDIGEAMKIIRDANYDFSNKELQNVGQKASRAELAVKAIAIGVCGTAYWKSQTLHDLLVNKKDILKAHMQNCNREYYKVVSECWGGAPESEIGKSFSPLQQALEEVNGVMAISLTEIFGKHYNGENPLSCDGWNEAMELMYNANYDFSSEELRKPGEDASKAQLAVQIIATYICNDKGVLGAKTLSEGMQGWDNQYFARCARKLWEDIQSKNKLCQSNCEKYSVSKETLIKDLENSGLTPEEQKEAIKLMYDANYDFSDDQLRNPSKNASKAQLAIQEIAIPKFRTANIEKYQVSKDTLTNALEKLGLTPEEQKEAMTLMDRENYDFRGSEALRNPGEDASKAQLAVAAIATYVSNRTGVSPLKENLENGHFIRECSFTEKPIDSIVKANFACYHASEETLTRALEQLGLSHKKQKEAMKLMRDAAYDFGSEALRYPGKNASKAQLAVAAISNYVRNYRRIYLDSNLSALDNGQFILKSVKNGYAVPDASLCEAHLMDLGITEETLTNALSKMGLTAEEQDEAMKLMRNAKFDFKGEALQKKVEQGKNKVQLAVKAIVQYVNTAAGVNRDFAAELYGSEDSQEKAYRDYLLFGGRRPDPKPFGEDCNYRWTLETGLSDGEFFKTCVQISPDLASEPLKENLQQYKITEENLTNALKKLGLTSEEQKEAMTLMRNSLFHFGAYELYGITGNGNPNRFHKNESKVALAVEAISRYICRTMKGEDAETLARQGEKLSNGTFLDDPELKEFASCDYKQKLKQFAKTEKVSQGKKKKNVK